MDLAALPQPRRLGTKEQYTSRMEEKRWPVLALASTCTHTCTPLCAPTHLQAKNGGIGNNDTLQIDLCIDSLECGYGQYCKPDSI